MDFDQSGFCSLYTLTRHHILRTKVPDFFAGASRWISPLWKRWLTFDLGLHSILWVHMTWENFHDPPSPPLTILKLKWPPPRKHFKVFCPLPYDLVDPFPPKDKLIMNTPLCILWIQLSEFLVMIFFVADTSLTWDQAQVLFSFVNNIPAGKAKRKPSLVVAIRENVWEPLKFGLISG